MHPSAAGDSDSGAVTPPQALASHGLAAWPAGAAILDVREADAFARGHLPGCGHVPAAELAERRGELPARHCELLIVADSAAIARAAAEQLAQFGYARLAWLDGAVSDPSHLAIDLGPAQRLWRPSPFLEAILPRLGRGRALDLAAGTGREAATLALHGFEVEAWDHDEGALSRARRLAASAGVAVTTRRVDLERRSVRLPASEFDVVTVFRFLHRPLFPRLEAALRPGGHLVYETFLEGQSRYGRPTHARFLLAPGELQRAFGTLEVLHYEETDPPGGPVLARLLARRPADLKANSSSAPLGAHPAPPDLA
ncbi:MAG: methyltransferase domain-containing protein [Candidatus Eisenbacteria bacterium]|uniref:Methyltransferase domain-containing protein n=1 Tax=Eiseniibacteriota bacterium TaxID=2212470 RepID=A0A849SLH5_UNCEI|nr:methyltransferase domain-containing protein [Candidatus Eisenbacteria bacterium]